MRFGILFVLHSHSKSFGSISFSVAFHIDVRHSGLAAGYIVYVIYSKCNIYICVYFVRMQHDIGALAVFAAFKWVIL